MGLPVVPEVYSRVTGSPEASAATRPATSSGSAASRSRPSAAKSSQVRYGSPAGHTLASRTMIRAQAGQAGQHRLPPGQLVRPVQHGDPGRAVPGHEAHLLGGEGGVEGDRDPAGVHGAEVRQHMLGPVGHHDRHPLAGGEAERDEAGRQFQRLLPGLRPAQGGPATRIGAALADLGQGRVVRELLGGLPELITDRPAPDRFLDLRPLPENLGRSPLTSA